ncbi:hypothetical protein [Spirulina sp. 06S082]|uniref:hypothetical protein n=1 Tax=Spirulina sp. 06S082 TaxID=3110248 RepID=UPI002B206A8C|nr:hypothetical protein [Spirulina sp. 06S082]MEA5469515.1 hypothetical protein [Spirulina sp. 06S082]
MSQKLRRFAIVLLLMFPLIGCDRPDSSATKTDSQTSSHQASATSVEERIINPDFRKLQGDRVSLYLPPGYEGGDPQKDIEKMAVNLEGAGSEYENLSSALRETKDLVALVAFDNKNAQGGFVTNVNVTSQKMPQGTNLEEFQQAISNDLERVGYEILEQDIQDLKKWQAGRITVKIETGKTKITQLVYIVLDRDIFWVITYSTPTEEFTDRVKDFEDSIITFDVQNDR